MLQNRFQRFLLVGGVAALVNFLARIALNQAMSFRWAVFVAYLIGMLTAYL
ncbi:MAG TPA: GtrA family protein, partial [Chromatiales bacterium]|nr:GtrA family protein [Chromatiales bacterium]